ncbi:MAG: N-acetyltransferase family protein [Sediminicola sp.]
METIIRAAVEKDIAAILEIINFEIENSTVVYDLRPRTFDHQLRWFHQKLKEGMPVLVAESSSTIVGYGSFGAFRPWDAYRFSVEHSIYVHHAHRGAGVGKLLLSHLIKIAREEGYHTMLAGIDAANKGSCEFHRKFGFLEMGTLKEVGFKFDTWLDLVFMQLFLSDREE